MSMLSMGVIRTSHYFSTMNIGPNVEDTKFDVVSLVTSHYCVCMCVCACVCVCVCVYVCVCVCV